MKTFRLTAVLMVSCALFACDTDYSEECQTTATVIQKRQQWVFATATKWYVRIQLPENLGSEIKKFYLEKEHWDELIVGQQIIVVYKEWYGGGDNQQTEPAGYEIIRILPARPEAK